MGQAVMTRSTDAADYQAIPRAVAVMRKPFAAGAGTGVHSHPRAQLLHASAGLMAATLPDGAWIVPEGYALWIPPGATHSVSMHGVVSMLTGYIVREAAPDLPGATRVIAVSPLLSAALAALADEPMHYDEGGRGGHLAALVIDEVVRAPDAALALPLPKGGRLRDACLMLIDDPALAHNLDSWAENAGLSRRTLTRRFRAETGMSFGDWRASARMMRAMALMADGRTAQQAAGLVGYRSPQTLRRRLQATRTAALSLST